MKFQLRPYIHPVMLTILMLSAALVLPQYACAECTELKIIEYEDRVEAVCVGEPLTDAQKKANLEEEKRQELEAQRQRTEEMKRQTEAAAASKSQAEAEKTVVRRGRNVPPVTQQPTPDKPKINLQKF